MNLDEEVLKLTCQLYANLSISKSEVQFIIDLMQKFVSNAYNPFLLQQLNKSLFKAVNEEVSSEINNLFQLYKDPFEKVSSEYKRISLYKKLDLYVDVM